MKRSHLTDDCDVSASYFAEKYCEEIKCAPFYLHFLKNVLHVAAVKESDLATYHSSLRKILKQTGLEDQLRNDIYYWMKEKRSSYNGVSCWTEKEPVLYLRNAQMHWENRIYKSINSLCIKLGVSLSVFRLSSERDEFSQKWNMLSTYSIDLKEFRPVYAPKDFLEVLLNVKNPNYAEKLGGSEFEFAPWINVKSLDDLKETFQDIVTGCSLIGTCDSSSFLYTSLENDRIALGKNVLKKNRAASSQQFLRCLAPHSLRGQLWAQVLGCDASSWQKEYFENLKHLVIHYDMLIDKLTFKDIQLTVCNDDQYFAFEDILYQALLCFSRDTAVSQVFRCNSSNPILGILKRKTNCIENTAIYPPSGVITFYGFSMYAAPLCYVFDDPVRLYFAFRSFYMRYWYKLHELNSHSQGILSLCRLFQQLLESKEPQLYDHFVTIEVHPVRVVFKWLIKCFSGYLPLEQLLYLWDLILGYDSLDIVPLLAVAILSFRKENLAQVDTLQNVEAVLADLSSIRVIPLLQLTVISE